MVRVACLLFLFPFFCGLAQDDSDFMEMSLDELLLVKVGVASKKKEGIFEAPGVVTIISRQEIEAYGGMTLGELLERIPGVMAISSYILPQNAVSVRGDFPGHTNAHILYLLDGVAIRDSLVGGFNADFLSGFPVNAIERVEVVRGPGSVLYGSNAYTGVINVITRRDEGMSVLVGAGSFSSGFGSLRSTVDLGKVQISADFYRFEEDGWDYDTYLFENRKSQQQFDDDLVSGHLRIAYKNLTFSGYYIQNHQGSLSSAGFASDSRQQRVFTSLNYEAQPTDRWQFTVNASMNRLRNVLPNGNNIPAWPESEDFVLENTHRLNLGKSLDLTLGASLYLPKGEWRTPAGSTISPYSQIWWNAYFQLDYRIKPDLKLIAGGQLNKPESVDSDFVPRLGIINRFGSSWGIKVLYGEAFRAAFPGETEIRIPGILLGTETLVPETIATLDAQIFFEGENSQVQLTWFDSEQSDLIVRIPSPDPGFRLQFANRGKSDSHGFELESKWVLSDRLFINGSWTWYEAENDTGIENPSLIPQTLAKLGVSYSVPEKGIQFGVFNTYSSKPGDASKLNPNVSVLNPIPDEIHNLSANIEWKPAFGRGWLKNGATSFRIYGNNLLDEDIYHPDFLFRRVNSFPGKSGRTIYGSVQFRF